MVKRESGHALVEALVLGLILMVPLVWLLTVLAEVHAAALATTSAARESGFEAARARDPITADREVARAVALAVADHGLDPEQASVSWVPARGWRRGRVIEAIVSYRVPVFQAPLIGAMSAPWIEVHARHVTTIDRYRSRPE